MAAALAGAAGRRCPSPTSKPLSTAPSSGGGRRRRARRRQPHAHCRAAGRRRHRHRPRPAAAPAAARRARAGDALWLTGSDRRRPRPGWRCCARTPRRRGLRRALHGADAAAARGRGAGRATAPRARPSMSATGSAAAVRQLAEASGVGARIDAGALPLAARRAALVRARAARIRCSPPSARATTTRCCSRCRPAPRAGCARRGPARPRRSPASARSPRTRAAC